MNEPEAGECCGHPEGDHQLDYRDEEHAKRGEAEVCCLACPPDDVDFTDFHEWRPAETVDRFTR